MKLKHIHLEQLEVSKTNVRKFGAKQVDDLVLSIETLGLLQPLLVRRGFEESMAPTFEIIAGQRRYHALSKIAENAAIEPVPCMVMEDGDDALAIEASLAENIARLPMDEIDQYKAFSALASTGLEIEDIAHRFGVSERLVKQRLAIARLHPPILSAYRKEKIDPRSLRALTLAPLAKQREWWALFKDGDAHVPTGHALKRWLLGGDNIPTDHALFALENYQGAIITDLFGDHRYFDDAAKFWELQNAEIARLQEDYLVKGWSNVTILDLGTWWSSWEHVEATKKDGGEVFVEISTDGAVTCHEGFVTKAEAKRREKALQGGADSKPTKCELTKTMQNYLDLHRHAAVKAKLFDHQMLALRIATAQIIAGSDLWDVQADRQKANTEAIEDSLSENEAEKQFATERGAILELLGLEGEGTLVPTKDDWGKSHDLATVLAALMQLDDEAVMRVFTFVVAECLSCGSALVEWLGEELKPDLTEVHQAGDVFFDLLKDKQAINAALEEVTDKRKAASHISDTAKVQKAVLRNAIKAKGNDWSPRYFRFPMQAYTDKGGIAAVDRAAIFAGSTVQPKSDGETEKKAA